MDPVLYFLTHLCASMDLIKTVENNCLYVDNYLSTFLSLTIFGKKLI